jgi:hypothetical protein
MDGIKKRRIWKIQIRNWRKASRKGHERWNNRIFELKAW